MKNKALNTVLNGILRENPVFALVLGMCPTLATTTSAINGMSMGLATTFVLICSNVVISLLKNLIPDKVRIPAFIVVIATFVTMVQLLLLGSMITRLRLTQSKRGMMHIRLFLVALPLTR